MIDDTRHPADFSRLSRRAALGAVGLGLGTAALAPAQASAAPLLDLNNPEHVRQLYRKLRYRADSGMVFGWVIGPHIGNVNGELTMMYGINLGSIQRVTYRPDGGFEVRELEINFTTDGETGKRITEYRNPYTNEILPVKLRHPTPSVVSYSRDNELHAPESYQGMKFEVAHFPGEPFDLQGQIYWRDRTRAYLSGPGMPSRTLNEISTFSAPREQALDPNVKMVRTKIQSDDIQTWPSWLKMASRPGSLQLCAVGGKVDSFGEMPASWLEMLHEVWPDIAADPISALDRPAGGLAT